ncbi:MAG: TlyA family RNA methyltransferase [Acidimicrobiales bacterium]
MTVDGAPAIKASRLVAPHEAVVVTEGRRFVSRGGEKLDRALGALGIEVCDKRTLDVGSSTGGFVQCLLERGARQVIAVDVGRGQMDPALSSDPRVVLKEGANIRQLCANDLGEEGQVELLTADLSFISLTKVASALCAVVQDGGDLVVLVKPQFEAERSEVSRGKGVIRDFQVWRRVLGDVTTVFMARGAGIIGGLPSEPRGASGNVEFFVQLIKSGPGLGEPAIGRLLDEVVESVRA